MKSKTEFILRLSAGAMLMIGVAWTIINLLKADNHKNKMRIKLDTVAQLQQMKEKNDALEASLALLQ